MLKFAILLFLAGAALGTFARLPALAAIIFGFVLAILVTTIAVIAGLGDSTFVPLALLLGGAVFQTGYGSVIIVRAALARSRKNHRRPRVSDGDGRTAHEIGLSRSKKPLGRLPQD